MSSKPEISDEEITMLDIERKWWQYAGLKEQMVRDKLDISMTAYYQRLNILIDTERAMARDPLTVKRLRRIRDRKKVVGSRRRA